MKPLPILVLAVLAWLAVCGMLMLVARFGGLTGVVSPEATTGKAAGTQAQAFYVYVDAESLKYFSRGDWWLLCTGENPGRLVPVRGRQWIVPDSTFQQMRREASE